MDQAIEAIDLTKRYGDVTALAGVSFAVAPGEIFAYLGRNGSGKSTTVRLLTTLARPTSGSARVAGCDVVAQPAEVRSHIGVTMQEAALDPRMTGAEHLAFIAAILGRDRAAAAARSRELLEVFGLTEAADRAIGGYSGGMARRLDIATALLGDPGILFLDEPTTGLDPQSRRATWAEIRRLSDQGRTVFLTTQYLEEADALADHLAVVDRGSVIARGTPAALKAEHGRRRLSFDATGTTAAAVARLGATPGYDVRRADGRIEVEVGPELSDADLVRTVAGLAADHGGLRGLRIEEATLEDVFLRLTGSAINDGGERLAVPA